MASSGKLRLFMCLGEIFTFIKDGRSAVSLPLLILSCLSFSSYSFSALFSALRLCGCSILVAMFRKLKLLPLMCLVIRFDLLGEMAASALFVYLIFLADPESLFSVSAPNLFPLARLFSSMSILS